MNVHATKVNDKNYPDLAVAVLAGGESRRFGADKALFTPCPDGRTLIEIAVAAGRTVAPDTFVVGHNRYATYLPGVPVIPDSHPGEGPLAGIQAALNYTSAPRLLVLACDMPCLSAPFLQWMVSIETNAQVVITRTLDGRRQPFPGIYRCSALRAIEEALAVGDRAVTSIYHRVSVQEIAESEVRALDPELNSLFSLNHPDQLDRIRQCVSCN